MPTRCDPRVQGIPKSTYISNALYKIIGRLDVSRKNLKVAATTEDWLWTQLCLTREQKEQDTPQDRYDLQELSSVLNKYGNERYDQKGTRPFAWFNLLLLTSQFEQVSLSSIQRAELMTGCSLPTFQTAITD
jgi:nuclear pore complex protein Nup93